jgi:hypothetical protein
LHLSIIVNHLILSRLRQSQLTGLIA